MSRARNTMAGRALFGLAVLATLAFGARQAAAAPETGAGAARVCSTTRCNSLCIKAGFTAGYCYDGYDCICY
ncbi:hypothetical protein [Longimicrobium sp.]|uniref:hypothetical protein n=1 Tax=Longimicrobium sp. TaxID=2029185 RepID=UPI003B3A3E7C